MINKENILEVKGRKLVNRKVLAEWLGITANTFRKNKSLGKYPTSAIVEIHGHEMWDIEKFYSKKVS